MSREVRHDGAGAFQVRFSFDRRLVDLIKTLPNRRWNAQERFWHVPEHDVVELVDLLHAERFRFDEATVESYRSLGGSVELETAGVAPTAPERLPGLFDATEDDAKGSNDFTVSSLNEQVRAVLETAFPAPVWIVGEISGFNRNAHKRHVSFQIVEREDGGKTVSSLDATLFERTRREVEGALGRAGDPFRLEDEVLVRMRARVELYVPWGSYRVIVEELDLSFTLGEAARRREEIIRRLTDQGLVGKNTALELPPAPLRIGLVTSLGSDAYNDVLRTLQESGFAFCVTAHGARVQGHSTEPSVLNALDYLRDRADTLDAVIVCRGGGSRTDLAWFDSEALGRAVALFPIPVVVGIGHEQDHSVLDSVGWRRKTPTAAAAFLVDTVQQSLDRVESLGRESLAIAARRIDDELRAGRERGRRLVRSTQALLERERERLTHRRERTARGAWASITTARERILRQARDVPRASSILLARRQAVLDGTRRAIVQGSRRDVATAVDKLDGLARRIAPRARRAVADETERAAARERRLRLVDPKRVLERGYSILRLEQGAVLTRVASAPSGTRLRAQLRDGSVRLVSEGCEPTPEGE